MLITILGLIKSGSKKVEKDEKVTLLSKIQPSLAKKGSEAVSKEEEGSNADSDELKAENMTLTLRPNYSLLWYRKVFFEQCDAGKCKKVQMSKQGRLVDVSHV